MPTWWRTPGSRPRDLALRSWFRRLQGLRPPRPDQPPPEGGPRLTLPPVQGGTLTATQPLGMTQTTTLPLPQPSMRGLPLWTPPIRRPSLPPSRYRLERGEGMGVTRPPQPIQPPLPPSRYRLERGEGRGVTRPPETIRPSLPPERYRLERGEGRGVTRPPQPIQPPLPPERYRLERGEGKGIDTLLPETGLAIFQPEVQPGTTLTYMPSQTVPGRPLTYTQAPPPPGQPFPLRRPEPGLPPRIGPTPEEAGMLPLPRMTPMGTSLTYTPPPPTTQTLTSPLPATPVESTARPVTEYLAAPFKEAFELGTEAVGGALKGFLEGAQIAREYGLTPQNLLGGQYVSPGSVEGKLFGPPFGLALGTGHALLTTAAQPYETVKKVLGGATGMAITGGQAIEEGKSLPDVLDALGAGYKVGKEVLGPVYPSVAAHTWAEMVEKAARNVGAPVETGGGVDKLAKIVEEAYQMKQAGATHEQISTNLNNPWFEVSLGLLTDPLNILGYRAGDRFIKGYRAVAERTWTAADSLDETVRLWAATAEGKDYARYSGFSKWMNKALGGRTQAAIASGLFEETAIATQHIMTSVPTDHQPQILRLMALMGSNKPGVSEQAAEQLRRLTDEIGVTDIVFSEPGQRTAAMLAMMHSKDGELQLDALSKTLLKARTPDERLKILLTKTIDTIETYYKTKYVRGGFQDMSFLATNPVKKGVEFLQRPIVGVLWLGYSYPYAIRNWINDKLTPLADGIIAGLKPTKLLEKIKERGIPVPPRATAGYSPAEVATGSLLDPKVTTLRDIMKEALDIAHTPASKMASAIEAMEGFQVWATATLREFRNQLDLLVKDMPLPEELPPDLGNNLAARIRNATSLSALDNIIADVNKNTLAPHPWRAIDPKILRDFTFENPVLASEVSEGLERAANVDDALRVVDEAAAKLDEAVQKATAAAAQNPQALPATDMSVRDIRDLLKMGAFTDAQELEVRIQLYRMVRDSARTMPSALLSKDIVDPVIARSVGDFTEDLLRSYRETYKASDELWNLFQTGQMTADEMMARKGALWRQMQQEVMRRSAELVRLMPNQKMANFAHFSAGVASEVLDAVSTANRVDFLRSLLFRGRITPERFRRSAESAWHAHAIRQLISWQTVWELMGGVKEEGPRFVLTREMMQESRRFLSDEVTRLARETGLQTPYTGQQGYGDLMRAHLGADAPALGQWSTLEELTEPQLIELAEALNNKWVSAHLRNMAAQGARTDFNIPAALLNSIAQAKRPLVKPGFGWTLRIHSNTPEQVVPRLKALGFADSETAGKMFFTLGQKGTPEARLIKIHVGSMDDAEYWAHHLNRALDDLIDAPNLPEMRENISIYGKVLARFEAPGDKSLGIPGEAGFPIPRSMVRAYERASTPDIIKDVLDRAHRKLASEYGAFYAGSRGQIRGARGYQYIDETVYDALLDVSDAPVADIIVTRQNATAMRGILQRIRRFIEQNPTPAPTIPLDATTRAKLISSLKSLRAKHAKARAIASAVGMLARDFALLNYTRRYNLDTVVSHALALHFWPTRSVINWGKRFANNPALLMHYVRFREAYKKTTGKYPEETGAYLVIGPIGLYLASTLNPLYSLMNDYPDYMKDRSLVGKLFMQLNDIGVGSVQPLWMFTLATILAGQGDKREAATYLPTAGVPGRVIKAATALVREGTGTQVIPPGGIELTPQYWSGDAPFKGYSDAEQRAIARQLVLMYQEGKISLEQLFDASVARKGKLWDEAMQRAAVRRAPGTLIGYVMGNMFRFVFADEARIQDASTELSELYKRRQQLPPEDFALALTEFFYKYPEYGAYVLSNKFDKEADTAVAWMALTRVAPDAKGRMALEEVGLRKGGRNSPLLDKFYQDTTMDSFSEAERGQFMGMIYQLAAEVGIPTVADQKYIKEIKAKRSKIQEEIEKKYPRYKVLEGLYFSLPEERRGRFLEENEELRLAWNDLNMAILSDPELAAYYADAADIVRLARSNIFEHYRQENPAFYNIYRMVIEKARRDEDVDSIFDKMPQDVRNAYFEWLSRLNASLDRLEIAEKEDVELPPVPVETKLRTDISALLWPEGAAAEAKPRAPAQYLSGLYDAQRRWQRVDAQVKRMPGAKPLEQVKTLFKHALDAAAYQPYYYNRTGQKRAFFKALRSMAFNLAKTIDPEHEQKKQLLEGLRTDREKRAFWERDEAAGSPYKRANQALSRMLDVIERAEETYRVGGGDEYVTQLIRNIFGAAFMTVSPQQMPGAIPDFGLGAQPQAQPQPLPALPGIAAAPSVAGVPTGRPVPAGGLPGAPVTPQLLSFSELSRQAVGLALNHPNYHNAQWWYASGGDEGQIKSSLEGVIADVIDDVLPGTRELQEQYRSLVGDAAKSRFLRQHPELLERWNLQGAAYDFLNANPIQFGMGPAYLRQYVEQMFGVGGRINDILSRFEPSGFRGRAYGGPARPPGHGGGGWRDTPRADPRLLELFSLDTLAQLRAVAFGGARELSEAAAAELRAYGIQDPTVLIRAAYKRQLTHNRLLAALSPALLQALIAYVTQGTPLPEGAMNELQSLKLLFPGYENLTDPDAWVYLVLTRGQAALPGGIEQRRGGPPGPLRWNI